MKSIKKYSHRSNFLIQSTRCLKQQWRSKQFANLDKIKICFRISNIHKRPVSDWCLMAHMDKARPQFVSSVSPSQRAALETCLSLVDSSHDRGSRRFIILFHLNPTSVQNELDMSGWSTFHTPTRAESRTPIVNGFELLYVCVCVCCLSIALTVSFSPLRKKCTLAFRLTWV